MRSKKEHEPNIKWIPNLFGIDFAIVTQQDYIFPRHFHDYYVIELVLSGSDNFYCNGKNLVAAPGSVIFINPGEVHSGSAFMGHTLNYFSLYPTLASLTELFHSLEIPIEPDFNFTETISTSPSLSEKMQRMATWLLSNQQDPETLQMEEWINDFIFSLSRESDKKSPCRTSAKDLRIIHTRDFIRENFKQSLSLAEMASLVNINPYYLCRLFKSQWGLSPYEYLVVCRVEYATAQLKKGLSVDEAGRLAGFYDSAHFNRLFRKMKGVSPRFFRSSKCQDRTILK